jgi:putative transposase
MLNRQIEAYQKDKTRLGCVDLCKEMTQLKKQEEFKWLNDVTSESLQQSIRNMDSAFTRFFREKKGFPKFKSKFGKQSCKFINCVVIDFYKGKIRLPRIGWVNVFIDRKFDGEKGTVTVSKNKAGKYFVTLVIKDNKELPQKLQIVESEAIGIDVGLKHFATLSTGDKIDNPKYYQNGEARLKVLQRRLSKKQKGSNRHKEAKIRLAKAHYKIVCKRSDFLHKLTSKIIRENQTIVIEDLNVKGMMQNHKLAKGIQSVAWYEFFRQLKYKANWQGKNVLTIGRFEPSSKMCPVCGTINQDLKLSDRDWTCMNCGTMHDRDIAAAINIKQFGLQKQNLIGSGEAIPVEDVESPTLVGAKKRQGKKAKANEPLPWRPMVKPPKK